MTVYLIRHGKTGANEQHLYCGSTDLPLSDGGREELKTLTYAMPNARYLTSGMLRTEQTLELLFGPVAHTVEPELREVDFGAFEMQSYEQLKDDPAYQAWISGDNEANVPPGGESGVQMRKRVLEAYDRILTSGQDTVIVTHGGVIVAIMEHLFPGENKNRYQWQPKNGYGYAIRDGQYWRIPR
ncbi:MAG: histidine phosphatase family protein [Faecousia sp.]